MQATRGRQALGLVLVVSAVALGMALAGLDFGPSSYAAAADPAPERRVVVEAATTSLPSFADLAAAVSPAVVSIRAVHIERGGDDSQGVNPFEFFFGPQQRGPRQQPPRDRRADAGGSGFVISSDGLVVTNHHVVEDATEVAVHLGDRDYPAKVIGDDPATDIALLKIDPPAALTYLELGDSEGLRVGSWVMVIGNPFRLDNSVSVGVVSAKGRAIAITPDRSLENFIQTDAAINFGNSGGPMVDLKGRVVGIATAINYGAENIGFAVPVSTLKRILPQLRETGEVKRGYLGVDIDDVAHDEAEAFGLAKAGGALVVRVREDGPAAGSELRHGDVIVGVDGIPVESTRDLIDYVSSQPPGQTVRLDVVRNGKTLTAKVELGERSVPGAVPVRRDAGEGEGGSIEWLGLDYRDLTPAIRGNHAMPSELAGVWVRDVAASSPLFTSGLQPGDVITEVAGRKVANVQEFEEAIGEAPSGRMLRLYVRRFDPRAEGEVAAFFALVRKP